METQKIKEMIPILYARLCLNCFCIFDLRKSKFYEEDIKQFCSKKCFNKFTIIPKDVIRKNLKENKQLEIFMERLKRERLKLDSKMRFEILKRDNFRCFYCGKTPKNDGAVLEIDHIIPIIQEGLSSKDNLVSCCRECNAGKSDNLFCLNLLKEIKERLKCQ